MKYLIMENRRQAGRPVEGLIDAKDKYVVVLGGGDTAAEYTECLHLAGNRVTEEDGIYRKGMVFRTNLDGSQFEVLGHNFRNNYEVAVDAYGTMWQSDNDDDGNRSVRINYVMEFGNYGFKDELTGAGWQTQRENLEKEIQKGSQNISGADKLKIVSERMTHPDMDVRGELESDIAIVKDMRKENAAHVDLSGSPEEIISSVREQAEQIGMGHEVSTAYHARKHANELPEHERGSHPIRDYLKSLSKTLKEGNATDFQRLDDGEGVRMTFKRIIEKGREKPPAETGDHKSPKNTERKNRTLRAHLFIRGHTGPRVSTYGEGKEQENERG